MSKITKKELGKKIAKYGALSLAIAGVSDAAGQVVYTDVDPDFVGGLGDSFAIDFNGDSVDDITVFQENNGNYEIVQALPAGGNGVIAASNGGYFYASNLSYGASIGAGAGSFRSFGDMCAGVGYLGSQFCGTGEGYIGVEFDAGGNTHYGWVLVEVADSSNFIVKGYAFDATPGTTITAGDEGTLGVGDAQFAGFNYFLDSSNALNLSATSVMDNVTIHNVLGQQVIDRAIDGTSAVIDLSAQQSGLYLVTVTIEGVRKTIKVVR